MPAALLAYTTEPPVQTVLWPFAEFSPEYQAMRWAVAHGVPVRFCDLPAACVLAEQSEASAPADAPAESVYGKMERVTGQETDVLWEYQFEQNENEADFLAAVEAYGASIREFSANDAHNQLREAYMRRVIAETEQSGVPTEKIAVITGAFHTAGLKNVPYTAEDAKLTAHLPTVPSQATLMPYSYYKLSNRSGYGAGSRAEVHNLYEKSLRLIAVVAVTLTAASMVIIPYVARFFVGYDPELLALTSRAFRLYALSFVIMGFNVYASSFFTALGDGVTSALISFLRTLVFQIAAVLILPAILGIDGIWLAVTAAELAALAVSAAMFVTKDKVFHYRKA